MKRRKNKRGKGKISLLNTGFKVHLTCQSPELTSSPCKEVKHQQLCDWCFQEESRTMARTKSQENFLSWVIKDDFAEGSKCVKFLKAGRRPGSELSSVRTIAKSQHRTGEQLSGNWALPMDAFLKLWLSAWLPCNRNIWTIGLESQECGGALGCAFVFCFIFKLCILSRCMDRIETK